MSDTQKIIVMNPDAQRKINTIAELRAELASETKWAKEYFDRAERAEAELAAAQHLLRDSLQREDRFYRELAALKGANIKLNETNTTQTSF